MKTANAGPVSIQPMNQVSEIPEAPAAESGPIRAAWLESGQAILDARGKVLEANAELAGWLGLTLPEVAGKSLGGLLAARHPTWEGVLTGLLEKSGSFQATALPAVDDHPGVHHQLETARHGDRVFVRLSSALPAAAELAEGAWDESLHSRRAQREMFTRLIRVESRLEVLLRSWPGVIFSQRADFSFQFVSLKMAELTGIPVAQWLVQPGIFWEVIHEADADEVRARIHRAALLRQPMSFTYRVRHALTGRVSYLLEHRDPTVTSNGIVLGYEGFWIDVTRQTIAERRLLSSAWKETLSVLTMGLAHDFRNLMAGIGALSEQLLEQLAPDHPIRENMNLIMSNSHQASQLVHRIISLHHGKTGERNYHDLNELLKEISELTAKIIPRRIQFETQPFAGALPVYLDAVELRQVIINLLLNAVDAMPDRGRLSIRVNQHDQLPAWAHGCGTPPRLPALALAITDDGTGIMPRHLANLFDPFFTTKTLNKGSGLGLYNARLFVEKHQGAISVESVEGRGTTFTVWLPIADFTEGEREFAARSTGRHSLLFAGAEGRASEQTVEFLRTAGYHVVVAHSCELARAMLEAREYPFAGMFVQAEDLTSGFCSLLDRGAPLNPGLKTVLQIIGRNEDEFNTNLLRRADALLGADLPQAVVLQRLADLLQSTSP